MSKSEVSVTFAVAPHDQLDIISDSDASCVSGANLKEVTDDVCPEDNEARIRDQERYHLEKRLVRKLDLCLLPVLILMCLFQAVDKSLIGIAKIGRIRSDLHLTQLQYNTALAIFQVGFLLFQLPSNLLITRVRPSLYLPLCCTAWSTVAACHALVHRYSHLLTARILLGVCDAPYFVGAIHVLSCWYTRRELAKRTSVLLGVMIVTFVVVFPLSAAIMERLDGRGGWKGWRWLYLVFGVSGIGASLLGWSLLPDYPESEGRRFWMTAREQSVARARIREDRVGEVKAERQKLCEGLAAALKDVRTWVFVLMFMSRRSLEGLHYYLPTIIKSLHLFQHSVLKPNTLTLLLGCPPALLAAVFALALAYTSDKYSERTFHIAIPLCVALIGLVLSAATLDAIARYISIYLYLAGSVAGTGMAWSWVPNTIQESPEKKACGIAIVNVLGGLGATWAPFLFRGQDRPRYLLAFGVICGFVTIDIGCCLVMRWLLKRQNNELKMQARERGDDSKDIKQYVL